jgi:hypothetical protein
MNVELIRAEASELRRKKNQSEIVESKSPLRRGAIAVGNLMMHQ